MSFEEVLMQILAFSGQNGWQITLIAIAGIVVLGVLKRFNLFSNIEKDKRKPIYLGISVGLSVIGSVIYLLIAGRFDFNYLLGVSTIMWGLNQAMYSIYENCKLRDLWHKLLDFIVKETGKN